MANSAERKLIPEMREDIMRDRLGIIGQILDGLVPLMAQRALLKILPGSETFQRLKTLNDYRQENDIPVGRNPL